VLYIALEELITMRRRVMGIIATSAVAAVVAVFGGTSPAYAATWTITPVGPFTAASTTTLVLTDTTTGTQLTCVSGTARGNTGVLGNRLAQITGTTWNTCSGPGGITFTVSHVGTWNLNGSTFVDPVTTGTITNVVARLSGPLCSATVSGGVAATYTNGTGVLQVLTSNSTLRISNVIGCFGLINSGDGATFSGRYQANPIFTVGYTP
jgi:hypothetical protein